MEKPLTACGFIIFIFQGVSSLQNPCWLPPAIDIATNPHSLIRIPMFGSDTVGVQC
jgi:hypothetical protein